jgi:hypothetical protein
VLLQGGYPIEKAGAQAAIEVERTEMPSVRGL